MMPAVDHTHPRPKKKIWIKVLLLIVGLLIFRQVALSFVTEGYVIPGVSMLPTLKPKEMVFINLMNHAAPQKGELVVFKYALDNGTHFLKRVIAVAGDRVKFNGHEILVNGVAIKRQKSTATDLILAKIKADEFQQMSNEAGKTKEDYAVFEEEIEGRKYNVLESVKYQDPHQGELVVPDGQVFVVGDNRDSSFDSRNFGPIAVSSILGSIFRH